jgi:hypothetical protein
MTLQGGSGNLLVVNNGATALTIANTGAATFAGAVNISGVTTNSNSSSTTYTSGAANPSAISINPTFTNGLASFATALSAIATGTQANAGAGVYGGQFGANLTAASTSGQVGALYLNTINVSTSTVANAYGIFINSVTGATNNFAIKTGLGRVSIGDTTAGSAGAGALVVSGGLATGAASYFGGNVQIKPVGAGLATATPFALSLGGEYFNNATPTAAAVKLRVYDNGAGSYNGLGNDSAGLFSWSVGPSNFWVNNGTLALTLSSTGATVAGSLLASSLATFQGGLIATSVTPVSTASSGGLSLKLGVITSSPSSSTDSLIAVQNTGGPGGLAGDLLYIPRSDIAASHRWFGNTAGTIASRMVLTAAGDLSLTGAATFAGAVTATGAIAIGNTTAAAVAAPSTHKVSILIGGVQYYLLASNV